MPEMQARSVAIVTRQGRDIYPAIHVFRAIARDEDKYDKCHTCRHLGDQCTDQEREHQKMGLFKPVVKCEGWQEIPLL